MPVSSKYINLDRPGLKNGIDITLSIRNIPLIRLSSLSFTVQYFPPLFSPFIITVYIK